MIFNIELPKKINTFNYFKKGEKGCTLYSYGSAMDGYQIIATYPELEIEKDFAIVDSTLNAIVKLGSNVEVKLNENNIVAKSEKGKYTGKYIEIKYLIPNIDYDNSIMADLSVLNKATMFASTNEKKPILTGINLSANGDVVATDSFKVYRKLGEDFDSSFANPNITIPSSLIKIASGLFNNNIIEIKFNNNSFCMIENNIMFVGRLLDGNFPKVASLYKGLESLTYHEINATELLSCIDFTKMTGASAEKKILLYAYLSENHFKGVGEDVFEKEIQYSGEDVIFDALFLEIVLKSFNCDIINIATLKRQNGCMSKFTGEDKKEEIILLGIVKED